VNKENCFLAGRIVRTAGVKGELSIELDVDDPSRYRGLDSFFAEVNGSLVPFFVQRSSLREKQLTVAVEGITDPVQAKTFVGCSVWMLLTRLPQLDETRFYFHEIGGFRVIDEQFGETGIAKEVMDRSMQPVLVVVKERTEILIPLAKGVVKKVDREKRELLIRAPEGLIDIYLGPGGESEREQDEPFD